MLRILSKLLPCTRMCSDEACFEMEQEEDPSSLLNYFPIEIVELIVAKVAANSVHDLLKLRLVCQTTKSWVDNSPPKYQKSLFSNAHICIECDESLEPLGRFRKSAPPFLITSLSLTLHPTAMTKFYYPEHSKERKMWNDFCNFWTPRLEVFTINGWEDFRSTLYNFMNRRGRVFLENLVKYSPNLRQFNFRCILPPPEIFNYLPDVDSQPFKSVSGLTFESVGKTSSWWYEPTHLHLLGNALPLYLGNIKKLTKIDLHFDNESNLTEVIEFVQAWKADKQLEISLKSDISLDLIITNEAKRDHFIKTLVASQSKIRLHLNFQVFPSDKFFFRSKMILNREEHRKLMSQIESFVGVDIPEPALLDLTDLKNLKKLNLTRRSERRSSDNLDYLKRFPSFYTKMTWGDEFPEPVKLPQSLVSITIIDIPCDVDKLHISLLFLFKRCINLETVKIEWGTTGRMNNFSRFTWGDWKDDLEFPANMKSFTIGGLTKQQDRETVKTLLLDFLKIDKVPLLHLSLSTYTYTTWQTLHERIHSEDQVIDGEVMKRISSGHISSTLCFFYIPEEMVDSEGIDDLKRLKQIADANTKIRIEREGRGEWLREYGFPQGSILKERS